MPPPSNGSHLEMASNLDGHASMRLNVPIYAEGCKVESSDHFESVPAPQKLNELPHPKSEFVRYDDAADAVSWKPVDEHDNPIWGWVAINHANSSVQLFMQDGSFYGEVRRAGALPQDDNFENQRDLRQLQLLAQRLGDVEFLDAFWNIVEMGTKDMPAVLDAYASFSSSLPVIGRPLALAHVRLCVDLTTDKPSNKTSDGGREFDGLVGYFPCRNLGREKDVSDLGLDLTTIISNYTASDHTAAIADPVNAQMTDHDADLNVYGLLVDPLASFHNPNGDLPVQGLILPSSRWQDAMDRVKAYLHMGPLVQTRDSPEEYTRQGSRALSEVDDIEKSVALPAMSGGNWDWLKLYESGADEATGERVSREEMESFMGPSLVRVGGETTRLDEGPFSAVEGYIRMGRRWDGENGV